MVPQPLRGHFSFVDEKCGLKAAGISESSYTICISVEPGLISYWRMEGKGNYRHVQDIMRTQGIWNVEEARLGVLGVTPDDTAARLDGTAGLIVAPFFRGDLPLGIPLEDLSAGSFTVEAWVQVGGKQGENRWILSHGDGTPEGTDFLLGIDSSNHFTFITGGEQNKVTGETGIRKENAGSGKWFHVVGMQDKEKGVVSLFVNGEKEKETSWHPGSAVQTNSSLQIGSRGRTNIADGEVGEGNDGKVLSSGFEFFKGVVDEIAVYGRVLSGDEIREHYEIVMK